MVYSVCTIHQMQICPKTLHLKSAKSCFPVKSSIVLKGNHAFGEIAIFKSPFKFLYHPVNGKYEKGNVVLVQISFIQRKAQLQ